MLIGTVHVRPLTEYRKRRTDNIVGWRKTSLENSILCPVKYLCKIQLQLLPVEVCFVQFYSSSCCRFRFAEIYSDSSKAFEQLKCNLVIIDGEKGFKSLLQIEEQQGRENGRRGKKREAFKKRKFKSLSISNGIEVIMTCQKSIQQVSCYSYAICTYFKVTIKYCIDANYKINVVL